MLHYLKEASPDFLALTIEKVFSVIPTTESCSLKTYIGLQPSADDGQVGCPVKLLLDLRAAVDRPTIDH